MPSRRLSTGSFNPAGALFAVTTSSCSGGRLSSGARRLAEELAGRRSGGLPALKADLAPSGSPLRWLSRRRDRRRVSAPTKPTGDKIAGVFQRRQNPPATRSPACFSADKTHRRQDRRRVSAPTKPTGDKIAGVFQRRQNPPATRSPALRSAKLRRLGSHRCGKSKF